MGFLKVVDNWGKPEISGNFSRWGKSLDFAAILTKFPPKSSAVGYPKFLLMFSEVNPDLRLNVITEN